MVGLFQDTSLKPKKQKQIKLFLTSMDFLTCVWNTPLQKGKRVWFGFPARIPVPCEMPLCGLSLDVKMEIICRVNYTNKCNFRNLFFKERESKLGGVSQCELYTEIGPSSQDIKFCIFLQFQQQTNIFCWNFEWELKSNPLPLLEQCGKNFFTTSSSRRMRHQWCQVCLASNSSDRLITNFNPFAETK